MLNFRHVLTTMGGIPLSIISKVFYLQTVRIYVYVHNRQIQGTCCLCPMLSQLVTKIGILIKAATKPFGSFNAREIFYCFPSVFYCNCDYCGIHFSKPMAKETAVERTTLGKIIPVENLWFNG